MAHPSIGRQEQLASLAHWRWTIGVRAITKATRPPAGRLSSMTRKLPSTLLQVDSEQISQRALVRRAITRIKARRQIKPRADRRPPFVRRDRRPFRFYFHILHAASSIFVIEMAFPRTISMYICVRARLAWRNLNNIPCGGICIIVQHTIYSPDRIIDVVSGTCFLETRTPFDT